MSIQNIKRAGFTPPDISIGSRTPPPKSSGSCRANVPIHPRALSHPRKAYAESHLEQKALYLLLARRDVYDIWDQPPAVSYRGNDGKLHDHTFDFLVTLKNKQRIAIAVKPMSIVRSKGFVEDLEIIRSSLPKSFADEVCLITDVDIDRSEAINARRLLDFRRVKDEFADGVVLELARELTGNISIKELAEQSKLGARAFRAIFRAIFEGVFERCCHGVIDFHTELTVGERIK